MNAFLTKYTTPHGVVPFDVIRMADFEPAIMEGMAQEDKEIEAIANSPEPPTFENTVVAMERTGEVLEKATTVLFNLLSAESSDELEALANKLSPLLSEHSSNIILNEKLFERVKTVRQTAKGLSPEDEMLLERTYEGFERSGATLKKEQQQRFREIRSELSQLTLQFSQNHLKETNAFTLHLTDEAEVAGLPESQLTQAHQTASEKGLEGWLFTLQAPSYVPFLTYADNRELRKELFMAYNTQCTHANEYNNYDIVRQIVNLRQEMAQLLGYETFAAYALKKRMAEKPAEVYRLLDELIAAYKEPAQQEYAAVCRKAKELEGEDFEVMPWDFAYYSHKLKKELFQIDSEMLRPYFELSKVQQGIFGLAQRLYGISFRENAALPVYHPEVTAYEVFDRDGSFLAVLYTDFHPRAGKQSGAWMTSYKEQWMDATEDSRPHVSLTTNFTRPTAQKPALLTLEEVETFLHEFGHCLHGIFARTRYKSLSGTNVYWDFVELPSQFMENYAVEKEFLQTFAYHYETGELIPDELVQRIIDSRNFNVAYACMRQVAFGLLDMAYYDRVEPLQTDIRQFEQAAWQRARILPLVEDTCMSVQFGHIMSGGYAAGYYSYKWAEVLDADAFYFFKEKGIFHQATADNFRQQILSQGGTRPPMELYEAFRGRRATLDALLRRNGIKR